MQARLYLYSVDVKPGVIIKLLRVALVDGSAVHPDVGFGQIGEDRLLQHLKVGEVLVVVQANLGIVARRTDFYHDDVIKVVFVTVVPCFYHILNPRTLR